MFLFKGETRRPSEREQSSFAQEVAKRWRLLLMMLSLFTIMSRRTESQTPKSDCDSYAHNLQQASKRPNHTRQPAELVQDTRPSLDNLAPTPMRPQASRDLAGLPWLQGKRGSCPRFSRPERSNSPERGGVRLLRNAPMSPKVLHRRGHLASLCSHMVP